jgi:hypothetical protein
MMPVPRRVLVVVLCLPTCVLVAGCAGPGLALPETSQLTCEDIGELTLLYRPSQGHIYMKVSHRGFCGNAGSTGRKRSACC